MALIAALISSLIRTQKLVFQCMGAITHSQKGAGDRLVINLTIETALETRATAAATAHATLIQCSFFWLLVYSIYGEEESRILLSECKRRDQLNIDPSQYEIRQQRESSFALTLATLSVLCYTPASSRITKRLTRLESLNRSASLSRSWSNIERRYSNDELTITVFTEREARMTAR